VKFFLENDAWSQIAFQEGLEVLAIIFGIGPTIRLRQFVSPEKQAKLAESQNASIGSGKRKLPSLIVIENPPTCALKKTHIKTAQRTVLDRYEKPRRIVPSVQFGTLESFNVFNT